MHLKRATAMIRHFIGQETAGGVLLVAAMLLAMLCVNTPLAGIYGAFFNEATIHIINDGLMVVFFLLVGLEIKREYVRGELSSRDRAILPVVAAAGGMIVPAIIFIFCTWGKWDLMAGWAIPSATDIAFTLGVLALLGSRVPLALKVLVTAIAVMDDLGAIIIIAVFYGHGFDIAAFCGAIAVSALLYAMNKRGVTHLPTYLVVGLFLWLMVLHSGIHATIAGVILAMFIPLDGKTPNDHPLEYLEHRLHPYVTFWILPIFALANAGVSFWGMTPQIFVDPVVLGITSGLFLGKQIGIFGAIFAAIRLGYCRLPDGVHWIHAYGAAILCGIGFTMSLFIGGLAYTDMDMGAQVRVGVILGSVLSGGAGYALLYYTSNIEQMALGLKASLRGLWQR
jgi:Na+:H+ antiporter, NhaA family